MASRFYDSGTGANLVLNNIGSQGTGKFLVRPVAADFVRWVDQPILLFIRNRQRGSAAAGHDHDHQCREDAHDVIDVLAGNSTTPTPNFNYAGFNYVTMTADHRQITPSLTARRRRLRTIRRLYPHRQRHRSQRCRTLHERPAKYAGQSESTLRNHSSFRGPHRCPPQRGAGDQL